ncbi:hypothetical protein Tco_0301183 [Tanacetum coccineum]
MQNEPVNYSTPPSSFHKVHIENPPSSFGTLSSMKNLEDAFTFGDQFINNKSTEEEPGKANVETEVESMVTVPIHQASSSVPPLSTPIIDLTPPKPVSAPVQEPIFTATTTTITTTTLLPPPPPPQQSTIDPDLANRVTTLEKKSPDFEQKHQLQDKTTKALASRVYKLEHHDLYSKIKKQVNTVVKEVVHNALQALLYPPPPPPNDSNQSKKKKHDSDVSASKQPLVQKSLAWKTSDTKEAPSILSKQKPASPPPVDDNLILDDMHLSESENINAAHLPKIKTRPDWLKPLLEEEAPKTLEPDWVIPLNDLPKTENNWADALAKTYKDPEENKLPQKTADMGSFINWYCKQIGKKKIVKADFKDKIDLMNPEGNQVVHDINKPLPLGGNKERRHALSISKLKAAYYPDFRLEEFVPSLWTESESAYDISSAYGISHWWFKHKEFYITRHGAPSDRNTVRSHLRILSVVSLKTFSRYGYTFLKKIVLRRADYKEYKISEADFKNLLSINLLTRNIVIRQCMEALQLGIESYQTKLNITQPSWDKIDFIFKEDYTIVYKTRAIIYRDTNDQKKMMRESEVHKFIDGTLTRILEKIDYMVKDYELFKFNPGIERRI